MHTHPLLVLPALEELFKKRCNSITAKTFLSLFFTNQSTHSLFFSLLHQTKKSFFPSSLQLQPCHSPPNHSCSFTIKYFSLTFLLFFFCLHYTSLLDEHFHGDCIILLHFLCGHCSTAINAYGVVTINLKLFQKQAVESHLLVCVWCFLFYSPDTGTAGNSPPTCRHCHRWAGRSGGGTGCSGGGRTRGSRTGRRWGCRSRTPSCGTSPGQPGVWRTIKHWTHLKARRHDQTGKEQNHLHDGVIKHGCV